MVGTVDHERGLTVAHRRNITDAGNADHASTWVVPGALFGAYVLTRLPFGMLAGLVLGFAAGWTLRAEQEGTAPVRSHRAGADEEAAAVQDDEKVDAMSDDSFPASDPPSYTPTRTGKPRRR